MSKELDYIADLERKNRTLKSLLYCTTKSCNNCGKVNCENFQRQRKNYCEKWVSYKNYIMKLEQQIEKMKCCENCKHYSASCCCNLPFDDCFELSAWELRK